MPPTEPTFDPAVCAVCESRDANLVFEHRGRAFTSDGRTIQKDIRKLQCCGCGAVRRGDPFDAAERQRHYASEYQLAARAAIGEPLFYTEAAGVPRSEAIADWLHAELSALLSRVPDTVLEVGCGEGSVMAAVRRRWPGARIEGIDLGYAGRVDGLNIRQGSYTDAAGTFDVVYSFAVIEHVASPRHFLSVLRDRLAPGGLLAVALPRLDAGSRELLFYDHLHHVHAGHMTRLSQSAGLDERGRSAGAGPLGDFGLHIFQRASGDRRALSVPPPAPDVRPSIDSWMSRCRALDDWLASVSGQRLIVWGLGEAFGLFRTYSSLCCHPIDLGVDDNPERFRAAGFSFPVRRLEAVSVGDTGGMAVLLTFSPPSSVIERLASRGLSWFDAISGESHSC